MILGNSNFLCQFIFPKKCEQFFKKVIQCDLDFSLEQDQIEEIFFKIISINTIVCILYLMNSIILMNTSI